MYVCMYVSICNASLLQPKQSRVRARRPNRKDVFSLLQKSVNVNVNVGSRIDGCREFHSFGAQAPKLRGPKLVVQQASTCRSPRAAKRRWRRLVLAVTGTHSSWRYCGAVWWQHLKMIMQSLKTILSRTGSQWRSSRSVDVMRWKLPVGKHAGFLRLLRTVVLPGIWAPF